MRASSIKIPAIGAALLAAALGVAGPAAPGAAEAPKQRLDQIERAIGSEREKQQRLSREAEALAHELGALRERAVTMARALQDSEEQLSTLEDRMAQLDADATAKEASFAHRRAALARLVAALTRLGRQPPEAALVLPGSPIDTVRTAQLLGAVTPEIEQQASALARELEALQAARAATQAQRQLVAEAGAKLATERAQLDALIGERAKLQAKTDAAQRSSAARLQRLARDAQDIRELIERLDAERVAREAREREAREAREREAREHAAREAAARAAATEREATERAAQEARARAQHEQQAQAARPLPPAASGIERAPRSFHDARGQLVAPARGRITLSFGQPGAGGQPHRGLTIETRPAAQIVAPYDGHIAFAGPFRAYGLILIIEHSEGYHTLLAGLGRIDGAVGQWVTAGEPVGAAGSPETGNPSIYIELRHNGQPIDPLPWLASRNEKVSG